MKNIQDIKQPTKDRNADYKTWDPFLEFELVTSEDDILSTSGNIKGLFEQYIWDCEGPAHYKTSYGAKSQQPFYDLVSAPMLLARLVAVGLRPFVYSDAYKVTWTVAIRHKKSGCIFTFYDYKGASSYGSHYQAMENKQAQKDFLKVLKALINPRFAHPYDSCVVGEIA